MKNHIDSNKLNWLRIAGISCCFIFSLSCYGQQEQMITQYMYNGLSLNPAYAGIHQGISISGLWREQWVAIDGAPRTQFVSIHSPLNYRSASLGALLYKDQTGVKTEYTGYFSYAYRIRFVDGSKLSLGLQANLHQFSNDAGALEEQRGLSSNSDTSDPLYNAFLNENLGFKWNFGAGVLWHSEKHYIGISVPQILSKRFFKRSADLSDELNPRLKQHFFAAAGYVIKTSKNFVIKPNLLFKYVESAPAELDLNMNVLVSEALWLGTSLRTHLGQSDEKTSIFESISGLIALQINPQFQLGYSYDYTITDINTNTHEVMLNYIFNLSNRKIKTPRYF